MNIRIALFVLLINVNYVQAQMTKEEAFGAGKSAGKDNIESHVTNMINEGSALELVPAFSGSTKPTGASEWDPEQVLWLKRAGEGKADLCSTGTNDGSLGAIQHCEAVNAILNAKQPPATAALPVNDPLLALGRSITANPQEVAGSLDGIYGDCQTVTKEIAAPFAFETCDEWSQSIGANCTIGRNVVIDPIHIYQCTESIGTVKSSVCSYGNVIEIKRNTNYLCEQKAEEKTTVTCKKTRQTQCVLDSDCSSAVGMVTVEGNVDLSYEFRADKRFIIRLSSPYLPGPGLYKYKLHIDIPNIDDIAGFDMLRFNYNGGLHIVSQRFVHYGFGEMFPGQLLSMSYGRLDYTDGVLSYRHYTSPAIETISAPVSRNYGVLRTFPSGNSWLQTGRNTFEIDVVTGVGSANFNLDFVGQVKCPINNCKDYWVNECSAFEITP